MGSDKLYWFIPLISESGYPKGDGLTWSLNELGDEFNDNLNKSNKGLEKTKSDSTFNTNSKLKGNYNSNSTAYESNANVIRKNLGNNVINDTEDILEENKKKKKKKK